MTPQHQPKVQRNDRILDGSFTTMDVISYIKECANVSGFYQVPDQRVKYFERVVRSRPSPASDEKSLTEKQLEWISDKIKKAQAEAARQARDKVLDVIRSFDACCCPHEMCHSGEGHDGLNCRDCVIKFIEESLRQEPPAP